jgi:peroxidase
VLGGAAKLAKNILNRPKHWGVPENEPLELNENYNYDQPPGSNQYHRQRPFGIDRNSFAGPIRKRERVFCRTMDGSDGICRPLTACYHRHGSSIRYQIDGRQCPGGLSLVCCPKHNRYPPPNIAGPDGEQQLSPIQLISPNRPQGPRPLVDVGALKDIVTQVFQQNNEAERSNEIERTAASEGLNLRKDSPSDLHSKFIQLRNTKLVSKLAKDGADFLAVASQVVKSRLLNDIDGGGAPQAGSDCKKGVSEGPDGTVVTNDDQCPDEPNKPQRERPANRRRSFLPEVDFSQTDLASRCPGDPVCSRSAARDPYRTYDGSCNNLKHTGWGKSNMPYTRILPPDYEDGVSEIRATGVTSAPLPNPRTISLATIRWSDKPDAKASLMLMQWGQFIIHDLSLAATTPMFTAQGTNIDCCNRKLLLDPRFKHPACISILLPDNDPFYRRFNVGCMNLVRSAPSPPVGCRLRAREQLNQLTSFLDGSQIYGNDEQQALGLRRFQGGLMKSSQINGMEFLPFDARLGEGCVLPTAGIRRGMRCFVAGDNRVNELTGLVTMHALFLREHNRIARILWQLNPSWPDERLYQEARRIVIAQLQHITYNEWLPLIVGPIIMRDFKLELSQTNGGYSLDYDPETDPSIINEFAGAAHRLHSLVQSAFNFQTQDGQLIQQFKLRTIFNNPASLYREGNFDACIHSMVNEPSQSIDNHFSEELTNHLFQDTNSSFGMDLVTVNIQRGRDHGLPGYNFFRQACGLKRLRSFEQLDSVMVEGAGEIFSQLYAHVDDIDLFIAGNYEKKLRDAMVGPVFACIIGEQYRRLKFGDRYWYENGNQAGAFTPSQLSEIKRSSLARIICDNGEAVDRIQPLAFLKHANWNPKVPCEQIPLLDLRHWQTERAEQFDPFSFRGSREPVARRLDTEKETIDDGLD